jgi:hypothetical protein
MLCQIITWLKKTKKENKGKNIMNNYQTNSVKKSTVLTAVKIYISKFTKVYFNDANNCSNHYLNAFWYK